MILVKGIWRDIGIHHIRPERHFSIRERLWELLCAASGAPAVPRMDRTRHQAAQGPCNVLTNGRICGAGQNLLQTDSLLKVTRIYSVLQNLRISRARWHGTFQSLGRHSLSEASACPDTVRYWLSSGAARCPPSAAPETRWRMPMSPLQALRKAPSHRQRGDTAAA